MSEFKDALAENTQATRDSIGAQDAEIAQLTEVSAKLQAALDQLSTSEAPTAEELAELRANTALLQGGLARLKSDDAPVADPNPPSGGTGTDTGGNGGTETTPEVTHTPSA